MFADFTWQASQEEFEKALGFDFSCVTRFRDCNTVEELFPTAAQVLKQDAEQFASVGGKIPCDIRTARILGRNSDGVGVVRVNRVETDGVDTIVDYDLVRILKGKSLPLSGASYDPEQFAIEDSSSRHSLRPIVQVGTERVIFLSGGFGHQTPEPNCAVMAPTTEIMSATFEGIADERTSVLGQE